MTTNIAKWQPRRERLLELLMSDHSTFDAGGVAVDQLLEEETAKDGTDALLEHLSFCSVIPEIIEHDSSEEKHFSKYTDILLAHAFRSLGFSTSVLDERADAADVDVHAKKYAFVADAKAFRLSRTAKNQKDFKVESMDKWRRDKHHALIVSPLFQYPSRTSQIYEQASRRNVCLLSYPHLRALIRAYSSKDEWDVQAAMKLTLDAPRGISATKSARAYWTQVNDIFRAASSECKNALKKELEAEVIHMKHLVEAEAKTLSNEAKTIEAMTHKQAIARLLDVRKIPQRLAVIKGVTRSEIFDY